MGIDPGPEEASSQKQLVYASSPEEPSVYANIEPPERWGRCTSAMPAPQPAHPAPRRIPAGGNPRAWPSSCAGPPAQPPSPRGGQPGHMIWASWFCLFGGFRRRDRAGGPDETPPPADPRADGFPPPRGLVAGLISSGAYLESDLWAAQCSLWQARAAPWWTTSARPAPWSTSPATSPEACAGELVQGLDVVNGPCPAYGRAAPACSWAATPGMGSDRNARRYRAGSSTARSVVMMANIPSASRTGTERVTIQISPPPASK